MARKGSAGGGLALILLVVIAAIAKYAQALLVIGVVVAAAWALFKLLIAQKADAPPLPALRESSAVDPAPSPNRDLAPAAIRLANRGVATHVDVPAPPAREGDAYWVPSARSVEVAGRILGGGIYFGTRVPSVQGNSPEPALVDPRLPVDPAVTDCSIRRLNYWPSYSGASPEARGAYLNWLASGRKDPGADLGYVFLYFYGLERRALYGPTVSEAAKAELPEIQGEIERLLAIYGHNGSFQMYAGTLLDLLKNQVVASGLYKSPPPPLRVHNTLSLRHRIALGECANDGSPLPSEWAYTWFLSDPTTRLRTPAIRCPAEFKRLFMQRYAEVFGAGLVLPKNKTRLKMERRPATATFGFGPSGHTLRFDLPDVTVLSSPVKKLQDLAESCYPQLDGYSRYIGKDASRAGSFDAMLELPLALWPDEYRRVIENMRKVVSAAQRPAAIPFAKFKSWFPDWQVITRTKLQSLYRVLREAGLGMEPDVRFGGAAPAPDSTMVLFADDVATAATSPSPRYTAAALTLQLGAAVAMADGASSDIEKGMMAQQLEEWLHLGESERRRLHAFSRLVLASPPKLNGIKAKVEALDASQREAIGDFLALIAQTDTVVTPAEIKTLERSFRLLGLDPQAVYAKLHLAATEPVTVLPGGGEAGHPIPRPPTAEPGTRITLDPTKIAALQKDSERVSVILGAIFSGESADTEPEPSSVEEEAAPAPKAGLLGLRAGDSAFVSTLLGRPHWTRAELEELAEDRGFMLDGVLERINDASLDRYDKSLLEGADPVDVNPDVARELLHEFHPAS